MPATAEYINSALCVIEIRCQHAWQVKVAYFITDEA